MAGAISRLLVKIDRLEQNNKIKILLFLCLITVAAIVVGHFGPAKQSNIRYFGYLMVIPTIVFIVIIVTKKSRFDSRYGHGNQATAAYTTQHYTTTHQDNTVSTVPYQNAAQDYPSPAYLPPPPVGTNMTPPYPTAEGQAASTNQANMRDHQPPPPRDADLTLPYPPSDNYQGNSPYPAQPYSGHHPPGIAPYPGQQDSNLQLPLPPSYDQALKLAK